MLIGLVLLIAGWVDPLPEPKPTDDTVMRVTLPTALQLARVRPIDIILAGRRIEVAQAQLERAQVLWIPDLVVGFDYLRHDGRIQRIDGDVITTSKSAIMAGAGPVAVFGLTDAIYSPLAAKQVVRGREAELQATLNDTIYQIADAYCVLQQARGEAGPWHCSRSGSEPCACGTSAPRTGSGACQGTVGSIECRIVRRIEIRRYLVAVSDGTTALDFGIG